MERWTPLRGSRCRRPIVDWNCRMRMERVQRETPGPHRAGKTMILRWNRYILANSETRQRTGRTRLPAIETEHLLRSGSGQRLLPSCLRPSVK